jgi:hypothetical protein
VATEPPGGSCQASLEVRRYRGSGVGGRARSCGFVELRARLVVSGGAERALEGEIRRLELVLVPAA